MSKIFDFYFGDMARLKCKLGEYFRQLREEHQLSLEELQNELNLYDDTLLGKIERGKIYEPLIVYRLCYYYGKRPEISLVDIPTKENLAAAEEGNHD